MNQGNTQMVNTGKTELERSGLDPELLERMDPKERRALLRRCGLDPDKYDF